MRRILMWGMCLALLWGVESARAQVRVSKSAGYKSAMDWSQLSAGSSAAGALFRRTLIDDLTKSGWFAPAAAGRGEFSLQGLCEEAGGELRVKCYVYEVQAQRNLLSRGYKQASAEARRLAHRVADEIIEAVTGHRGMFSGRLAVVGNRTGTKEIYLCSPDGQDLIQLTRDKKISVGPNWGPDGQSIVYTSYLKGYPDIYQINIASGDRRRLSSSPGLNAGAAISPNGREMALVLSKDGNPELYILNLRNNELTRLTSTPRAAEASPSWSPDGNRIVYVSDQSGSPQLYIVSRSGGKPTRLTSRGSQNVAPDWGPGGLIAYASLLGRFQVCVIDPNTFDTKQVSPGDADYEDPCWAPDGRHIACGRGRQYRSAIYLLDTLGDPPIALLEIQGDWYSPSWSPK